MRILSCIILFFCVLSTNAQSQEYESRLVFAQNLLNSNLINQAGEVLEELAKLSNAKNDYRYHFLKSQYYTKKYKPKRAKQSIKIALRLSPENSVLVNFLGTIYFTNGEYQKAKNQYIRTYNLDSTLLLNSLQLSRVYYLLHEYDSSFSHLVSVPKGLWQEVDYNHYCSILVYHGRYELALSFTKVLDSLLEFESSWALKFEIYSELGMNDSIVFYGFKILDSTEVPPIIKGDLTKTLTKALLDKAIMSYKLNQNYNDFKRSLLLPPTRKWDLDNVLSDDQLRFIAKITRNNNDYNISYHYISYIKTFNYFDYKMIAEMNSLLNKNTWLTRKANKYLSK